jgi:hypothetical protein
MLTWKKLVPAVIVPTAVCLTAQTSLGGAVEECRTRPGLSTPRGSHWYYRINRPDRRHCWFLAAEGRSVRAHGRETDVAAAEPDASTPKSSTPNAEPPRPGADAAAARATLSQAVLMAPNPADVAVPEVPVRETGIATGFAARWPSPSGVRNLDDSETGATNAATTNRIDAEQQATATAAEASIGPVVKAQRAEPASEGQEVLQTASLASGAALALLFFAGWLVKAGGRSRLRLGAELAEIDGGAWAPASPTGGPAARLPTPTDPAVDLKTSLAELMRDLRRADALSHAPQRSARPVRRKQAVASRSRSSQ